jgi:hypothetical protein
MGLLVLQSTSTGLSASALAPAAIYAALNLVFLVLLARPQPASDPAVVA